MIGPFCAKYTTFELKKYRGVIFHDTEESDSDLENDTEETEFGLENDRNLANFHQNTWVSKLIFSWASTYRGVISNDTEEWLKIWRGIDLSFQNWNKEFDKFKLKNLKVSKIYTLMGCMTLKNNEKSEEELTCRFKIYIKNFCINSNNWIFYKHKKLK